MRDKAEEYLEALRRALDKAEKLDDIFDKHMENRAGKYIVFCANREHMDDMIDKADEWFHKVDKGLIFMKLIPMILKRARLFMNLRMIILTTLNCYTA